LFSLARLAQAGFSPANLARISRGAITSHRPPGRRPNELVRWYRTDTWLTDGKRPLMWEYPRQAPDGDQVELVEVMEIEHRLVQHHRIYWGWFGVNQLTQSAVRKATQPA
jgi:hypothetical protein